jgi:hypothetical protein
MLPRMLRTYPTEFSDGAKEKRELLFLFLVHGGSPSPPILFLSRGARLCHRSPTNGVGDWSFTHEGDGGLLEEMWDKKHTVPR